ncbi:MAG: hypothetical protein WCI20_02255 [bacterium]
MSRRTQRARAKRGQAITEYVVLLGITVPLVIWLFHPDNEFYTAIRDQYNLITVLLLYPGP